MGLQCSFSFFKMSLCQTMYFFISGADERWIWCNFQKKSCIFIYDFLKKTTILLKGQLLCCNFTLLLMRLRLWKIFKYSIWMKVTKIFKILNKKIFLLVQILPRSKENVHFVFINRNILCTYVKMTYFTYFELRLNWN